VFHFGHSARRDREEVMAVRWSRVAKATPESSNFSIDAVDMNSRRGRMARRK